MTAACDETVRPERFDRAITCHLQRSSWLAYATSSCAVLLGFFDFLTHLPLFRTFPFGHVFGGRRVSGARLGRGRRLFGGSGRRRGLAGFGRDGAGGLGVGETPADARVVNIGEQVNVALHQRGGRFDIDVVAGAVNRHLFATASGGSGRDQADAALDVAFFRFPFAPEEGVRRFVAVQRAQCLIGVEDDLRAVVGNGAGLIRPSSHDARFEIAVAAGSRDPGGDSGQFVGFEVIAVDVARGVVVGGDQPRWGGEHQIAAAGRDLRDGAVSTIEVDFGQSTDEGRLPVRVGVVLPPDVEVVDRLPAPFHQVRRCCRRGRLWRRSTRSCRRPTRARCSRRRRRSRRLRPG